MRKAKTPGIQQAALLKAIEGLTTIEEVSRLSAKPASKSTGKPKAASAAGG